MVYQRLSTSLSWQSHVLEFTEIVLKYSDMLHNYYTVCFEGVIQALDTLLNIYIYYELLKQVTLYNVQLHVSYSVESSTTNKSLYTVVQTRHLVESSATNHKTIL